MQNCIENPTSKDAANAPLEYPTTVKSSISSAQQPLPPIANQIDQNTKLEPTVVRTDEYGTIYYSDGTTFNQDDVENDGGE